MVAEAPGGPVESQAQSLVRSSEAPGRVKAAGARKTCSLARMSRRRAMERLASKHLRVGPYASR